MKKYSLILAVLVLSMGTVNAADSMSAMDAFNAGKDFANTGKDAAKGKINAGTGSESLPYYGSSASETQHFQNGRNIIGGVGTQKITDCKTSQAGNEFAQQECDAVNYLSKLPTTRPQYNIDKNTDPLIIGSDTIINNPPSTPGSTTNQCRVETVVTPGTFTEETCTEANAFTNHQCNRRLIVNCEMDHACALGGIVPNTWEGDMLTSFTPDGTGNYILQFGTIADNYWPGQGTMYDRNLVFDIADVEKINLFTLFHAAFDDYLWVQINGVTVYVGPYGGSFVQYACVRNAWNNSQTCGVQTTTGGPVRAGDLKTSWNIGLNTDLRPYLVNGTNRIFMRTIVYGAGEGAIRIRTQQQCPMNCKDTWDESECAQLKERSN